ncbi:MAG: cadherin domain-containing protein [Planctomycetaceae bacterium]
MPINNDRWYEGQETFSINMTATLASVQSTSVTVTIDDQEDVPVVYVQDQQSVAENVAGGNVVVPITLSNPSRFLVSVNYATSDGKAAAGQDYSATNGTSSFAVGTTGANILVPILNDTTFLPGPRQEWAPPEDFFVTLTGPVSGRLTSQVIPYQYYTSNWNGAGTDKETVIINDEQAFPMPTTTLIGTPTEGGGSVTLRISRLGTYAFEAPTTLKYTAYWNFYDQSAWQWHGGTEHVEVCGSTFTAPPIAQRLLKAGQVTFLPNGQLQFDEDISNLLANGLRDPQRYLTIDFQWDLPPNSNDYYYYPNPPSIVADIADDVPLPTLIGMTMSPATVYENGINPTAALPNRTFGTVTLSGAWSVPQTVYLSVTGTGATAADVTMPNSIIITPGTTVGQFEVNAVHDYVQTTAEGNEILTVQAYPGWGGSSVSASVTIVDATVDPPSTIPPTYVVPSAAGFQIPDDLVAGEVVAGFEVRNGSFSGSPVTTNGPFALSGNAIVYTGAQPLISGQSFAFSINPSSTNGLDYGASYSFTVIQGDFQPIILGPTQFTVVEGAGALATVGSVAATDPDGQSVKFGLINPGGTLPFTINADNGLIQTTSSFNVPAGTSYTLDLGFGTVVVDVLAVDQERNTAPIALPDTAFLSNSNQLFIDVLSNDFDPEGGILSQLQILNAPVFGTAVIFTNASGVQGILYTPGTNLSATETFTYQIQDDLGNTGVGAVTVRSTAQHGKVLVEFNAENAFSAQPYLVSGFSQDPGSIDYATPVRSYTGGLHSALAMLKNLGYSWDTTPTITASSIVGADIIVQAGIPLGFASGGTGFPTRLATAVYSASLWQTAMAGVYLNDEHPASQASGARYQGQKAEYSVSSPLLDDVDRIRIPSYFGIEGPGTVLFQGTFVGGCDYVESFPVVIANGTAGNAVIVAGSPDIFSDQGIVGGNPSYTNNPDPNYDNDTAKLWTNTISWLSSGASGGNSAILESYHFTVPKYASAGAVIGVLPFVSGRTYVPVNWNGFSYNAATREITITNAALLTAGNRFDLPIEIRDGAIVVGSATATVVVTWPNRAPTISVPGPLSIFENSLPGTVVGQLSVSDPDGGTHTWQIVGGNASGAFQIDNTGRITVAATAPLDFEVTPNFTLQVKATDQVTWNPLSDTKNVTVQLQNIVIEINTSSLTSVAENSQTGTVVGTLSPKDWNGSGPLLYSIRSVVDGKGVSRSPSLFSIVPTGNLTASMEV